VPGGFQATIGGTVREGSLENAGVDFLQDDPDPLTPGENTIIPYFGPLTGHGVLSYSFAQSRGLLQLTARYESARYVNRTKDRKLGDFFDMDTALSYQVTPALGLVARVDNISAGYLERWERYPEPPFAVMAGMQIRW
ncbi:MAG TPA: TonB-dependent receptor, partial [Rhodothermales bacterium]|nr:TonB-dependent receptor [Rhodothermales bacterium]